VLPVAYLDEQHQSERKYGSMLRLWADNEARLAARALAPLLNAPGALPFRTVEDQLAALSAAGRRMYLMFRPAAHSDSGFYLVASTPQVSMNGLDAEWQQWHASEGWPGAGALCVGGAPGTLEQPAADAVPATIRSIAPLATPQGCWLLITAFDTQYLNKMVGAPQTLLTMGGTAAALYLGAIALGAFLLYRSWQGLRQFSRIAREISERGARPRPFAQSNTVPELAGVATDFDRLVTSLQGATERVKRSAEDNAHALKTPLATIRHSLQPIKRSISTENDRASRAVDLIEQSIVRLEALVSSAQHVDVTPRGPEADDTPRPIDLSQTLAGVLHYYRKLLAERDIAVSERLQPGVLVEAAPGTIEAIFNNIIDNAVGFTPPGGEIAIGLVTVTRYCELTIEDSGPGVDPADLERIFDRYVSLRPRGAGSGGSPLEATHSGLGLWIVRHSVETLGGTVMAANRPQGGLSIRITLPTLS
jgi:two-component system sensor histidine kinase ChvG